MKIRDIFEKEKRTFSFEFFPPKDYSSAIALGISVGQLIDLKPSFISVTYGAGGSTQENSFSLLDILQNRAGLTCMAHYTCVNARKEKIDEDLKYLYEHNIENLMLLRGDPPKGHSREEFDTGEGFNYANDLVEYVNKQGKFGIGVAGYPETHPDAPSPEEDINNLKKKVDAGGDFIVTQMFFRNEDYFDYVERVKAAGISARVIPGIMPVTNYKQIQKFAEISGNEIPKFLKDKFEPIQNDTKKMYEVGIEHAVEQCSELLKGGAPGLHFYTLNKSRATIDIYSSLPKELKEQ